MKNNIKKVVCMCTAVSLLASLTACGKGDSSSQTSSTGKTTTTRQVVTTAPVEETLSGLDLSDVQNESNVAEDFEFSIEAEDCKLSDNIIELDSTSFGEFSGKGFVALGSSGDEITFDMNVETEGSYDITMVSCATNSGSSNSITIDGETLASFTIDNDKLGDTVAEKVVLPAGDHTIGIKADDGKFYVDSIKVTPAALIDLSQYEVSNALCNPNASEETQRLYNFLTDVYGKYTISGQYAADNMGMDSQEFQEIKLKLDKYPAMIGLDLSAVSGSSVANGSDPSANNLALTAEDWWLNQNGIVTLCWHWTAPEKYINYNGGAWWNSFYTEYTNFNLASALDGSDPDAYDSIIADIDAVAEILKELDDYHVPVLFRPLHEAGGDYRYPTNQWFWWGAAGEEAYEELWKLMYDRLTNYHNINNLIWVWNAQIPSWYPGDEYVDVIGYDAYPDAGDYSSQKTLYDLMKTATSTNKIIAMTENGNLFDPDSAFSDGTRWAWFGTWNGEFTLTDMQLGSKYTSLDMWEKVYNSDRVLTLDELPDLKNYPLDTEKYLEEHPDEATTTQ